MISNNADNPHQLWSCVNRTLHRKALVSLPAHHSINSLCNSFSRHFRDNIAIILASFQARASRCNIDYPVVQCLNKLHLLKLINWFHHPLISPENSLYVYAKSLSSHTNNSSNFQDNKFITKPAVFPSHFKHIQVNPLLKKPMT